MRTKRMMRRGIGLLLLATLPWITAAMAKEQEPAEQLPVVTERGESVVTFTWSNTETEPNNISSKADDWCGGDPLNCGGINGGIIGTASDVDYWELYVPALYWSMPYPHGVEQVLRDNFPVLIDIEAQSIGSPLNATICLYSDDGFEVGCSNDTDTTDPMLFFNFEVTNATTPRHYYLAVRAHNGIGAGANGKYQLLVSTPYLFSAAAKGLTGANVEGIPLQAGDILAYSEFTGGHKWVMLFDLSDLSVKGNVTNLSTGWRNSDYLLIGFAANATLPGINRPVTPGEVVVFDPTQIGPNTQGTFQLWWDGRNQGLTTSGEKIDAIDWPNWNGQTRLFASTMGAAKVYGGPTANVLRLPDEDIGLWTNGPAAQNYPRWIRIFDTSIDFSGIGDVIASSYTQYHADYNFQDTVDGGSDDRGWWMVVEGNAKRIAGLTYSCYWDSRSDYDECWWHAATMWDGPAHGWNYNIDAFQAQETIGGMQ